MNARIESLTAVWAKFAIVIPTSTTVGHKIFDAVAPFRNLLETSSLHDYEKQEFGGLANGESYPAEYVSLTSDGTVVVHSVRLTLYRAQRRGDRRFNVSWGEQGSVSALDFLAFTVRDGEFIILNLTRGLSSPEVWPTDPHWSELIAALAEITEIDTANSANVTFNESGDRVRTSGESGQGRPKDSALRGKIENYAVDMARSAYLQQGAITIETLGKPYDLKVNFLDRELHVEVKGSRKDLETVFVTRNEVKHARSFPDTELFVVDRIDIKFVDKASWELSAGRTRRWSSWSPAEGRLTPLVYKYLLEDAE